jgi:predicted nucleic acid-binding protein
MKSAPAEAVVGWTAAQPASSLYTSSITQAEIFHGIMLLPSGKRRRAIEAAAQAMFSEEFEGRVLAFGSESALPYARIAADRRRAGRPIAGFDAQIAAIARTVGAVIATRNVADFADCGVEVVKPWDF